MTSPTAKLDTEIAHACVALGLIPPFTPDKAKSRYRELAKLYHPDVGTAKDNSRFAEISKAYDLVTEHASRIARAKIGLVSDTNALSTQLSDVLDQLHNAKLKNISCEKKIQQLQDENEVIRNYAGSKKNWGTRMLLGAILLGISVLALGFLAGMFWSTPPAIMPLAPQSIAVVIDRPTTGTVQGLNIAELPLRIDTMKAHVYIDGSVTLKSKEAHLESKPSIRLESFVAAYDPQTTATGLGVSMQMGAAPASQ